MAKGSVTLRAEIGDVSSPPLEVEVIRVRVLGLELRPGDLSLAPGETESLWMAAFLRDGRVSDMTALATWASDAPEVAEVDVLGRVTAHAPGTATITARWGELTATPVRVVVTE
ncbi:MAG: Ig-like domain-containing protein [Deltaproteobacteria bacterium]|nr:Ig-like domain-containing protein [Deltaproteobacteria bacterium]